MYSKQSTQLLNKAATLRALATVLKTSAIRRAWGRSCVVEIPPGLQIVRRLGKDGVVLVFCSTAEGG